MRTVIKVENLSKQYRLGDVGTGTLSHDLKRWWYKARGKEDPYLLVGETNDRSTKGESDYVWALRDINFEVKAGEVLGIIGRNGAGKSTLLKILSKTTTPTTGSVKVKGRIASLLEVGTGFHPELTGRENIFLNGAILGMTKREIQRKFDEIVDFSGVERYIDTPVKRYSSGMYVRLAFAVAAHLEPEILIVDEVLAVGDAEFQKKCLGKMKDVSVNEGRTVLFVSHNMGAVSSLCNQAILLQYGSIATYGITHNVVKNYFNLGASRKEKVSVSSFKAFSNKETPVLIEDIFIRGHENNIPVLSIFEKISVYIRIKVLQPIKNANVGLSFFNEEGIATDAAFSWDDNFFLNVEEIGHYFLEFSPHQLKLTPGRYNIGIAFNQHYNTNAWEGVHYYPLFEIDDKDEIEHWPNRDWAIHHLSDSFWSLKKM
jgi:lipopolysaccharide transport system ATP-binding protein